MRRLLLYFLLVAVIIAIFGFIFFFFKKDGGVINNLPLLGNNPFGTPTDLERVNPPNTGGEPGGNDGAGEDGEVEPPLLTKVWDKPVAGFLFADLTILISTSTLNQKGETIIVQIKATSSVIFFVERATGHIYKKDLDKKETYRVTNTTIPDIYDAYFFKQGSYVAMRSFDSKSKKIKTFISVVPAQITVGEPLPLGETKFLQDDISSLIPSYDENKLFYLVPNQTGSSLYEWTKEKGSLLVNTYPLKELLLSAANTGAFLTTKASAFTKGYTFSSNFVNIYGGKTGMTSNISPKGDDLLVSMWSSNGLVTYIRNLNTGSEKGLNVSTLAEKCTWPKGSSTFLLCFVPMNIPIPSYGYPDDWYQGLVSFDDSILIIDNTSGMSYGNIDPNIEIGESFDIISPMIKRNLDYAAFINNKKKELWLLDLKRILN